MKIFRRLFLVMLAIALSGCALFDRTAPLPMAGLTTFTPTLKVQQAWATQVGEGVSGQYLALTPALVGNEIFATSYSGLITAINQQTGKQVWRLNTKMPLTSGPVVDQNLVFVGTATGQLLAYRLDTGALAWQAQLTNEVLTKPMVANNVVVVKSEDDHLYAFNEGTGQALWNYQQPTPELILRGGSVPVIYQDTVIVGFANGQLVAFNLNSGNIVWEQQIAEPSGMTSVARMIDIDDNLILSGNTLYVGTYQGVLAAVNASTGQVIWQQPSSSYAGIALKGNTVFVADADSHVLAFDQATGKPLWNQSNLFNRGLTGPAVVGNGLVVGDAEGYVHWLSIDNGQFLARAAINTSGIIATPLVNGRDVYVYSNSGRLVKFTIQ